MISSTQTSDQARSNKKLLILDLDNTLFDWVTYYARSFRAMIGHLARLTGIPEKNFLDEFKAIHRRYQTSEYAFSIQELPSLRGLHPDLDPALIARRYWSAVEAFRRERERYLTLYPGVRETLDLLKSKGIIIAGHSDSMSYYVLKRLQVLDLLDYFDRLYALEDHVLPEYFTGMTTADFQERPLSLKTMPPDQHKPNPAILSRILADFSVAADEAVFVGDSMKRDVSMADSVGVFSIWARYGTVYDPEDYSLLVSITHWTEEDIRREISGMKEARPSLIIDSFTQIANLF